MGTEEVGVLLLSDMRGFGRKRRIIREARENVP